MGLTHFPNGISVGGVPFYGGGGSLSLPPITGTYYHVCPGDASIINAQGQQIIGLPGNSGLDKFSPLDSIVTAYNKCVDGAGDGIILWSYGVNSSNSTSYIPSQIFWNKSNITVVGMSELPFGFSPVTVTNSTFVMNMSYLIKVIGNYNSFHNIKFTNTGNTNPSSPNLAGAISINGDGNYFNNVHFDTMINYSSADTEFACPCLMNSGIGTVFNNCRFGNSDIPLYINPEYAAPVVFAAGGNKDCVFNRCIFETRYAYSASMKGTAIYVAQTGIIGTIYFIDPIVVNYPFSLTTPIPSVFAIPGSGVTGDYNIIITGTPTVVGYGAWDDGGAANKTVLCSAPVASNMGGIVTSS
jgi:hypothetical protein